MKKMAKILQNWANMAGTEKTGAYQVFAQSNRGRVGVRKFPNEGVVRIRLEPVANISPNVLEEWKKKLPKSAGYKQPGCGGQNRFSIVVEAGEYGDAILDIVYNLLGKGKLKSFAFNPELPNPPSTESEALAA